MFLHSWKYDAKIEHLPSIIGNILRILAKMRLEHLPSTIGNILRILAKMRLEGKKKRGVDVFYEILTLLKSKLKFGAALGKFFRNPG